MNLDLRTMMVMLAVLSFLCSILLALADLHARDIRGLKQWALASLLISLGFSIAYSQITPGTGWPIVAGACLVAAGSVLQLLGIQAFKGQACHWRTLSLVVLVVAVQSIVFTVIQPNVNLRAMLNSLVFAGVDFTCALALLIRIAPPQRTAYWLTGASFALLGTVHAARFITIFFNQGQRNGLYDQIPINPLIFFTGSITHLFITFGFILMVNYRLSCELDNLATTDPLTSAWNRRSLEQEFKRLLASCSRKQQTLSVLMLDVDHFKRINDQHGHIVGDEVLRNLIGIAKSEIRCDDYLARFGGEEFCLLLPDTSEAEAAIVAERLRSAYLSQAMFIDGRTINSTISIGVASSEHAGLNFLPLLESADAALYQAKQTGRNKVVVYSELSASAPKTLATA